MRSFDLMSMKSEGLSTTTMRGGVMGSYDGRYVNWSVVCWKGKKNEKGKEEREIRINNLGSDPKALIP